MGEKIIIEGEDGFRALEGETLFTSEPWLVSKERIQDFCRSVDNQEWFHWDEDAVSEAGMDSIIAPGFLASSLAPQAYWSHVSLRDVDGRFVGADRIRLLQPIMAGDRVVQEWRVNRVEDREPLDRCARFL